jgi:two-component system alkaline phosphatase synthesis response regulator PhoP
MYDPKEKLILIVDDEETILEFLQYYLKDQGFKVDIAFDGQQALEKIKNNKPDLVILDAMLPKKSGYEIVKLLQHEYKELPVLVITGHFRDIETQMMFKLEPNVKEFLVKPVQPDFLISKVHSLLKTKPKEISIAEQKVDEFKKKYQ